MPRPAAPGSFDGSLAFTHAWFAEHVLPHEAALRNYLHASFRTLQDFDDIIQEAYTRVLKAQTKAPVTNAKSFLFTTARNIALDQLRRRQVVTTVPIDENHESSVIDSGRIPCDAVCHDQEARLLQEALASLPARCREVFALRKLQRLSRSQIAEKLGISENTVNAHLALGMLRCRKFFAEHGGLTSNNHESA